jgi:hypothetical protein
VRTDLNTQEYEADVDLILQLWQGFSDSWVRGLEEGYAFMARHNHAILECNENDFDSHRSQVPDPLNWAIALDATSIERQDSWVLRDSTGALVVPEGRIYRHRGTATFSGDFQPETRQNEAHSAVLHGEAVFFFPCRD